MKDSTMLLLMAITILPFSLSSASSCSCSDLTITDSQTGQATGACLTGISGQACQEGRLGQDQQAVEPAEQGAVEPAEQGAVKPAEQGASFCLIPINQFCLLRVKLDLFGTGSNNQDGEVGTHTTDQDEKDGSDTAELS